VKEVCFRKWSRHCDALSVSLMQIDHG